MWYTKVRSYWHTLQNPPETSVTLTKDCDISGCPHRGEYKAPRSRYDLKSYYWFCLEHVTEYNKNWDFFKGMSQAEIEKSMSKTAVWDRPTWRSTQAGFNEERLKKTIYERFAEGENVFQSFTAGEEDKEDVHMNASAIPHPAAEALAVMGLAPPIQWDEVKARYKTLAKKYHPDTNKNKDAEEQLKKINLAYSILKLSYQNYIQLDEK